MDENKELRHYAVAVANTRTAKRWRNIEMTWQELLERLKAPTRTGETVAEYKAMTPAEKGKRKDKGGFVGGYLEDGIRKRGRVKYRSLLCLDADNIPKPETVEPGGVRSFPAAVRLWATAHGDTAVATYSTHSHTPQSPRFRIVIPLSRKVSEAEYEPLAREVAKEIGIEMFDPTTYEATRLMYWPSAPDDGEYVIDTAGGNPLDVETVLAKYENWRDATAWPIAKNETAAHMRTAKKLGDPREKPGIIGLFCRAYDIEGAIEKFLPGVYTKCDGMENRYTYAQGTTAAGFIVYDEGQHAYSHHGTDPISGQDVNSFDLVRLNKFGALDEKANADTPVNKLPSFTAMADFARADSEVKKLQNAALKDAFRDDLLEEDGQEADLDWLEHLHRAKSGKIVAEAFNFQLILENDPRLKGMTGYDQFAGRIAVLRDLPWRKKKPGNDVWVDADDAQLRSYISITYEGLQGSGLISDAFTGATMKNAFHPVLDWLATLKWDGKPRARKVLIKYLGAKDTPYTEEVTEKFLKAAVARVKRPGCKFDFCLVLVGPQGIGKSTVLSRLGGQWFNDTIDSIKGKDAMEQLLGSWIIEMGEMQAATRAENDALKAYISRQNDKFRPAYGRRTEEHPRQCVFAATTNERIFLKDRTGGRRFWPVTCEGGAPDVFLEFTKEEAAQVWAEVVELYKKDKSLMLSREALVKAKELQEQHTEGAEKLGLIQNYLDTLLPEDWDDWTLDERRLYLNGNMEGAPKGVQVRKRVCAMEIWCECLENSAKNLKNIDARELNTIMQRMLGWHSYERARGCQRFKLYGIQRAYVRDEHDFVGDGLDDLI